jgi:hypothetical protein
VDRSHPGRRAAGVERNLVVTVYDWLSPQYYIHDLISTDRRNPTVNAYGLIYGATELSTDHQPILDPAKITKTTMKVPDPGFGMRGMDVDRHGVAWVTLASGHLASFDRRRCKGPLNGPGAAEGNLCPEGWTFYPLPGPTFAGRDGAAEGPYYTWVDQHNILGLGPNTPIGTGNFSDSLQP